MIEGAGGLAGAADERNDLHRRLRALARAAGALRAHRARHHQSHACCPSRRSARAAFRCSASPLSATRTPTSENIIVALGHSSAARPAAASRAADRREPRERPSPRHFSSQIFGKASHEIDLSGLASLHPARAARPNATIVASRGRWLEATTGDGSSTPSRPGG